MTSIPEYQAKRQHLKRMLKMAESLPDGAEAKDSVIEKIKTELLYLKLHLNCVYFNDNRI